MPTYLGVFLAEIKRWMRTCELVLCLFEMNGIYFHATSLRLRLCTIRVGYDKFLSLVYWNGGLICSVWAEISFNEQLPLGAGELRLVKAHQSHHGCRHLYCQGKLNSAETKLAMCWVRKSRSVLVCCWLTADLRNLLCKTWLCKTWLWTKYVLFSTKNYDVLLG